MSVALSYYNLMDNWEDDHSAPSLIMAKRLRKRYEAVSERYPRQCAAIHYCLTQLGKCERSNCQDIDQVSGHFGQLMAEVLDVRRDMWSADLQEMGMALGKFIYLMDAYEDLRKDRRRHRYNPLAALAQQPDYEQQVHDILVMLMAQCASAFERLPILPPSCATSFIPACGPVTPTCANFSKKQKERQVPDGPLSDSRRILHRQRRRR